MISFHNSFFSTCRAHDFIFLRFSPMSNPIPCGSHEISGVYLTSHGQFHGQMHLHVFYSHTP